MCGMCRSCKGHWFYTQEVANVTCIPNELNVRQFSIIIIYHMISLIFGGYSFQNNQKHDNPLMLIIGNSKCNKLRGLTFDKKNFL